MNRAKRAQLGNETVQINHRGWYQNASGQMISIEESMNEMIKNTLLFRPDDFNDLATRAKKILDTRVRDTAISVVNTTTLEAASTLREKYPNKNIVCLNFASAKNPGGGFLSGSGAQEESLARSSGLYESLIAKQEYYNANRAFKSTLYTDHMIYSPNVPVFRHDNGKLLDKPYVVSFLTSPAVNAGVCMRRGTKKTEILEVMRRRTQKVLDAAIVMNCDVFVSGAWGCGVFRNDPCEISGLFREFLGNSGIYAKAFKEVVFAVLDTSSSGNTIKPFCDAFPKE